MPENSTAAIQVDLNEFKLNLNLKNKNKLTLHFNTPSRRFYLSIIAFVVHEMKRLGNIKSIPLQEHLNLLSLLNESIGGSAGSSERENLLHRIYTKWKNVLPNLEDAPLFKVLGRKKEHGGGGKSYSFSDLEKDSWANLFEYLGSNENVRLKFAIDRIGIGLENASIIFGDSRNGDAWERFISSLETHRGNQSFPAEGEALPEESRIAAIGKVKYPLAEEPSIAVLPFLNMSEDPKQEFLSDGMTEEIITALSRIPRLFVISRTSTFAYKGTPVTVKRVSEDLGVRYVLEGSVRKSRDRVRVTVQLIDALTGNHIWADRYDRDLKDIFELQDEITMKILLAVKVKLQRKGGDVSTAQKYAEKYYKGKQGLDCYMKLLEADVFLNGRNIADNIMARQKVEEAIAMCPENPAGYIRLGWTYLFDLMLDNTKSRRETIEKGIAVVQKALAIEDLSDGRALLIQLYLNKGDLAYAIAEGERVLALNPNNPGALYSYASALRAANRPEEAIPLYQKAIRLTPIGTPFMYADLGRALRSTGLFEEAVSAFNKAIQLAPEADFCHADLAGTYLMIGREKDARAEAAVILRINPKYSADSANRSHYRDLSDAEKIDDVLRKVETLAFLDYANHLRYAGRSEEAIPFFQKAIQLNPIGCPAYFYNSLASVFRNAGHFEEAVSAHRKAIQLDPNVFGFHLSLTITYSMMGREKDARAEAEERRLEREAPLYMEKTSASAKG